MQPARCPLAFQRQTHLTFTLSTAAHHHIFRRLSHTHKHSTSNKLFADAAREEAEDSPQSSSKSSKIQSLEQKHENWTGEESIQDAVLRMLVDKYKPLRGPTIVTAEQKLKQSPPKVSSNSDLGVTAVPPGQLKPSSGSWADVPLLPSNEAHKPWETRFKTPSGEGSLSIKTGGVPPPLFAAGGALGGLGPTPRNSDERLARQEREKRKRARETGRLSQALDSTLDYKLGIKREQRSLQSVNPTSVRGWNSLIEEKIERARSAGLFTNVKGRGQPLTRSTDESNPFIAREEFLMNRIIQRNGAIPPWVEAQSELDTAVTTFRELLRQSWVRRALRVITTENPAELLHKISLDQIKRLRDPDWVKKEQKYHETAISELNSLIRKYNGLAPYSVRRSLYYTRENEIERMYETCAEDIMRELQERLRDPEFISNRGTTRGPVGSTRAGSAKLGDATPSDQDPPPPSWRFWDLIRQWFNDRFSSKSR